MHTPLAVHTPFTHAGEHSDAANALIDADAAAASSASISNGRTPLDCVPTALPPIGKYSIIGAGVSVSNTRPLASVPEQFAR